MKNQKHKQKSPPTTDMSSAPDLKKMESESVSAQKNTRKLSSDTLRTCRQFCCKSFKWLETRLLGLPATKVFRTYWKLYGGWRALSQSPYLYVAGLLTILLYPFWNAEGDGFRPWSQVSIDTIPSMLGFSMGGMAIMLAFSSAKIFRWIAEDGNPYSAFMRIIASFFHFILVQTTAIIAALFSKAYSNDVISAFGTFMFIYAILVGVATAGQLLQAAQVFNATASIDNDENDD